MEELWKEDNIRAYNWESFNLNQILTSNMTSYIEHYDFKFFFADKKNLNEDLNELQSTFHKLSESSKAERHSFKRKTKKRR